MRDCGAVNLFLCFPFLQIPIDSAKFGPYLQRIQFCRYIEARFRPSERNWKPYRTPKYGIDVARISHGVLDTQTFHFPQALVAPQNPFSGFPWSPIFAIKTRCESPSLEQARALRHMPPQEQDV